MSPLQTLPQEVLEILFMYLDIEDLHTVWKVVDFEASEFFWRKLCKRDGYENFLTEGSSWKRVYFYCNSTRVNWITQRYVKREYKFDKPFSLKTVLMDCPTKLMNGENLAVVSKINVVSFWNIHQKPELIQELPAEYIKESTTNILTTCNTNNVKLYSWNHNSYSELSDLGNTFSTYNALTDEYAAVFDATFTFIRVFDIKKCEDFTIPFSKEGNVRFIELGGYVLYVMIFNGSQNVVKRYDLKKRVWLDDLISSQESGNIVLKVTSDIVVCYPYILHSGFINLPIEVWKSNGQFSKLITNEFIGIESTRIMWLIVEGEYIIFSKDSTNITIWCSKDHDICKQIHISDHLIDKKVIFSHLLALIYKSYFKVFDLKNSTYLYDVQLDIDQGFDQEYLVNENFFVLLNQVDRPKFYETSPPISCGSTQGNCQNRPQDVNCIFRPFQIMRRIPCILTIYDFRSQEIKKMKNK